MLNISSKTKSHILVLIFGPHVPLWLPSIVTLHLIKWVNHAIIQEEIMLERQKQSEG